MRPLIALALAALVITGCGVRTQDRPEPVSITGSTTPDRDATAERGGPYVLVYLVRGDRLEGARRSVRVPGVATALEVLATGPTRAEVVGGLRTALAPQDFTVPVGLDPGATISIDVTRDFTGVAGDNQLLAVAQVVWTVTQFPDVRRVRLTSEGAPLEIPTDEGLTDGSVDRDDFRSVAAADGEPLSSDAGTTPGTAPDGTTPPGSTPGTDPATTAPATSTPTTTGRSRAPAGPRPALRGAARAVRHPIVTVLRAADDGSTPTGRAVRRPAAPGAILDAAPASVPEEGGPCRAAWPGRAQPGPTAAPVRAPACAPPGAS